MKNFFTKTTVLIIGTLSILLILNFFYKRTNHWKYENDVEKFRNMPYNVQLANVGSSHGQMSLNYDVLTKYVCANFGLSCQRHDMSYLLLKEYIDHISNNAILLIPISYFEITSVNTMVSEMESSYYRVLSPELVPNYSLFKKISYNLIPLFTAGNRISKILEDISENENVFTKITAHTTKEKLKNTSYSKYKSFIAPSEDKGEEGFAYNQQAVAKIIDLCHEHNIKPVLITTPITDVLNEYFDNTEGFFDTFYRFIDAVKEKYPDIPYFDYSHDERFSPDYTLFYDTDHLNTAGAEKFTRIVVDDLEQAGLLVK